MAAFLATEVFPLGRRLSNLINVMNLQFKKRTVLLVDHGVNLLDLSAPLQTFTTVNALAVHGEPAYEMLVVSIQGGLVETACGQKIMTAPFSTARQSAIDTLFILGGCSGPDFEVRSNVVAEIEKTAPFVRRLCALGTGIFVLAAAGQVTERHVASHWSDATTLQRRYPTIKVDADKIFLRDGAIWTSAGLAASFDLTLALIEEDCGHALAIKAARQLVLFMKRSGLQSQISISLAAQSSSDWMFAELHAWMAAHLQDDLSVARLAEQVNMAPRTFARIYSERVGRTPAKMVEAMRLEAVCRALENPANPLKGIAVKVGMLTEQNLQRAFKRVFGMSPSHYRAMYRYKREQSPNQQSSHRLTMEKVKPARTPNTLEEQDPSHAFAHFARAA